eukprot:09360.XXX_274270_273616_1 [CDS] Oithona nana genome sequencing.
MNYAPPDMHSQYSRSSFRGSSSVNQVESSIYGTLPRTTRQSSSCHGVTYATLPSRRASTSSELKSEYKRVSSNTSLLHKSDYSSKSTTVGSDVTSTLQHRQSFGSMTSSNFGYLTPTSRRRWSSVSTPVTPIRSPATTPRVMSPTRTFSPATTRRYSSSSTSYQTYSTSLYRSSR